MSGPRKNNIHEFRITGQVSEYLCWVRYYGTESCVKYQVYDTF